MTVSVLLRCRQPLSTNADTIASYINILELGISSEIMGGSIKSFKSIDIISDDIRTLKSKLLPCFVLLDTLSIIKTTLRRQPATCNRKVSFGKLDRFLRKEFAKLQHR